MAMYKVLILGTSYGSLLGTKLAMAGHEVTLVCLPAEAETINRDGAVVRLPVRGREPVEIRSKMLPGKVAAAAPGAVAPADYDLVGLAMQEPQYRSDWRAGIDERPSQGEGAVHVDHEYAAADLPQAYPGPRHRPMSSPTRIPVWRSFDPAFMTLCGPDPQAFRPPDQPVNVLQVTLPTNFKVARFEFDKHTQMLRDMQTGIEAIRWEVGREKIVLPVKLKVHDSVFVLLAKWAMLLTGNYG